MKGRSSPMNELRSNRPDGRVNGPEPATAQAVQPSARSAADPGADRNLFLAETHYAARRRRERFLGSDLLGEPAWDILLDLYIASKRSGTTSTTSACLGAHVPATTALRWLQVLQDRGLIERHCDQRDHRRTLVRLSRQGIAVLDRYFDANWKAFEGDEMAALWDWVGQDGEDPDASGQRSVR